MKKINESDMKGKLVRGDLGSVKVFDAIEKGLVAGVRVVRPMSKVPAAPHSHRERQLIYLISGKAWVSNGSETAEMVPGDFAFFDPDEEHYVTTEISEAKLFEIKYP
ncbi:cupin domain-containing protein [Candidatus Thorarchaeota archaeon]|nr:MAG: cupin domain-containing protein [Candidatus Thorarchaeota archaeon]